MASALARSTPDDGRSWFARGVHAAARWTDDSALARRLAQTERLHRHLRCRARADRDHPESRSRRSRLGRDEDLRILGALLPAKYAVRSVREQEPLRRVDVDGPAARTRAGTRHRRAGIAVERG